MAKTAHAKLELVVEAVRHGLEGDAAVEFIHRHGYAMTVAGIAKHLRRMGGRGKVQEVINQGKSNHEVLRILFPEENFDDLPPEPPSQGELFADTPPPASLANEEGLASQIETRKITLKVPEDLYEAIRIAAKAEHKSQNDLIIEILTRALSQMPFPEGE